MKWQEDNLTAKVKAVIEKQMRKDDKTTASQLHVLLVSSGYRLNLRNVLHCKTALGWTFRGSVYILPAHNAVSLQKKLELARANLSDKSANMILTDECSVQLETHPRHCCHKQGMPLKNKPYRSKGISMTPLDYMIIICILRHVSET